MTRPAIFARMGTALTAGLGNVDILITLSGVVQGPRRGILRGVREGDLLDIEAMGVEGISFTLSLDGALVDGVRQGDIVEIIASDDGKMIGDRFRVAAHIDDGRAMKRLLLHEEE